MTHSNNRTREQVFLGEREQIDKEEGQTNKKHRWTPKQTKRKYTNVLANPAAVAWR